MTNRADLPELAREAGERTDAQLLEALSASSGAAKAPPQALRGRLLAAVTQPRLRYAPLFGALFELFDLRDADLAGIFERAATPSAWLRSPIPQTELLHLTGGPRVAGADNGLVRIAAGARFPPHRHLGRERVLLLAGGYRDEQSGLVYRAGDVHDMPEGSTHAYTVLPDAELLLAVSVVRGVEVEGFGTLSPASV